MSSFTDQMIDDGFDDPEEYLGYLENQALKDQETFYNDYNSQENQQSQKNKPPRFFENELTARNYIEEVTITFLRIPNNIVSTLEKEYLSEDHQAYLDPLNNVRYNISLLQTINGFSVVIDTLKLSSLVSSVEAGNFELFNELLTGNNSPKAIAKAFATAIQLDKPSFVLRFLEGKYLEGVELFRNPLITAIQSDSLQSFLLFRKFYEFPRELVARVLFDDAQKILNYLVTDAELRKKILYDDSYIKVEWIEYLLSSPNHQNETINTYKRFLQSK